MPRPGPGKSRLNPGQLRSLAHTALALIVLGAVFEVAPIPFLFLDHEIARLLAAGCLIWFALGCALTSCTSRKALWRAYLVVFVLPAVSLMGLLINPPLPAATTGSLYYRDNGERWGFIDRTGAWVMPAQYFILKDADCPFEARDPGLVPDRFREEDRKQPGKHRLDRPESRPAQGKRPYVFIDGCGLVLINDLYGYQDPGGKWIIPARYKWATRFNHGAALVSADAIHYQMIGTNGRVIRELPPGWLPAFVECEQDPVFCFYLEKEVVPDSFAKKYMFIDTTGKTLFVTDKETWNFHEGRAMQCADKGRGYVDLSGQFVIPPIYDVAYEFHEGTAVVEKNGNSYYIDKDGRQAVHLPFNCTELMTFSEGLASVRLKLIPGAQNFDRVGFVDRAGQFVIPPVFEPGHRQPEFVDGLAAVKDPLTHLYGFISKSGVWVIPPQFQETGHFDHGFCAVSINKNSNKH